MAEYHVGCGIAGIYAGTLHKKRDRWNQKSDVTKEAIDAVIEYLMMNDYEARFTHQGKRYVMQVVEIEGEK